jgi:hypothetical protein
MAKKQIGWKGKIPFSKSGSLLSYHADYNYYSEKPYATDRWGNYWVDNFVFEDTLEFESCHRGRSSATFRFTRSGGETVDFFMHEVTRLFPHFKNGKVTGKFTFVKKGTNYSCAILE